MTGASGPDYQRVADDLKSKIRSGELAIAAPIPSTPQLMKIYGVSSTSARRAVTELKNEGVLRGQPGKAVYVEAVPEETITIRTLRDEIDELRQEQEAVANHVAELQAHLMDLYARVAEEYPGDTNAETPTRRRDTGT